jgi:hypothetical protein
MFEQAFKNIDDVLWKEAGCTTELDYTEQTSWLLFLKYLDGLEQDKAMEAKLEGKKYSFILDAPYRWESWAAPKDKNGKLDHNKALTGDDLREFVDRKLFPYLHGFRERASGPNTIEYKIGEIFGEIKNKVHSGYKGADGEKVLRIDPDELREEFPGYTGENAWLFQRAVIPVVERIHDLALRQKQSFLLDGTLSSYRVAERNTERSLEKGRTVQILYVYQEPQQAWKFVQAREAAEGRRIQPEDFVRQYFAARGVVNRLKVKFGKAIQVDLLMKNNDGSQQFYRAGVDQIDNHIPEKYTETDLRRMLSLN